MTGKGRPGTEWTKEMDEMILSDVRVSDVAKRLGLSLSCVYARRHNLLHKERKPGGYGKKAPRSEKAQNEHNYRIVEKPFETLEHEERWQIRVTKNCMNVTSIRCEHSTD